MTLEQVMVIIVTPAITLLGVIFIAVQNRILKTRIDSQSGVISDLKSWKEMIDINQLREANSLIMEGFTVKNEKEKEELTRKFKETIDDKVQQLSSTKEEFDKKLIELSTTDQKLSETTKELERTRKDLQSTNETREKYTTMATELLHATVNLMATYLPKEQWKDFAKSNVVEAYPSVEQLLDIRGKEISEAAEVKLNNLDVLLNDYRIRKAGRVGNRGFVDKIIKSNKGLTVSEWIKLQQVRDKQKSKPPVLSTPPDQWKDNEPPALQD